MKSREQEETLQLPWNQQGWRRPHLQETRQENEEVLLSSQNALGLQPAADQGCPGWTGLSPPPPLPHHLQLKKRGSHVVTGGFCSRSEELRCPDVA